MISPAFSTTTMSPTRMSLASDELGIVQRCPAHLRAGQAHRLQIGDRRQRAELADLQVDAQ